MIFCFLFQENSTNLEVVEQTYRRNPILRYTQHPLHSPLLPLPYGDVSVNCKYFTQVTESTYILRVSEEPVSFSVQVKSVWGSVAHSVQRGSRPFLFLSSPDCVHFHCLLWDP